MYFFLVGNGGAVLRVPMMAGSHFFDALVIAVVSAMDGVT